jgi:DNA-binding response OmpR family regulator
MDPGRRAETAGVLRNAGFTAHESETAAAADAGRSPVFDLIVLDGQLGEGGVLAVCRRLVVAQDAPILILSDVAEVTDRVLALELGADDLLGRPFDSRELLARARALLRRSTPRVPPSALPPRTGEGELHRPTRTLIGSEAVRVTLTPTLLAVLEIFLSRPGEALSAEEVAKALGGAVSISHFRTTIVRLRRKLQEAGFDPDHLASVRSDGYRLDPRLKIKVRPT